MVYLGKPASELDPERVKRGYAALARMQRHLAASRFLIGDAFSLADVALLAYTRWRARAASISTPIPRCGAGSASRRPCSVCGPIP